MSHAKASPWIDTRVPYCGDNAHPPRKPRTKEQRRPHRRASYLHHRQRLLREMKEYRDHKRDRTKAAEYQRTYYLNNKARLNAINRAYYHKHKIRLNKINSTRRRAGIIKTDMLRKREWTRERRKQSDYRARERLYRQRVNVKIKHNLSRRIRRARLLDRATQALPCFPIYTRNAMGELRESLAYRSSHSVCRSRSF